MKNKLLAIQVLSICDIGLAIFTYFSISNFEEFKAIFMKYSDDNSVEFIMDVYKLFMQTVIFTALIMVIAHLIIYYYYYKDKKFAQVYVKFYSILAGVSLLASAALMNQFILLVPAALYFFALFKINSKTIN